jgi:hypothetical protein
MHVQSRSPFQRMLLFDRKAIPKNNISILKERYSIKRPTLKKTGVSRPQSKVCSSEMVMRHSTQFSFISQKHIFSFRLNTIARHATQRKAFSGLLAKFKKNLRLLIHICQFRIKIARTKMC